MIDINIPTPINPLTDENWLQHPYIDSLWISDFGRVWRSCHVRRFNKSVKLFCGNFVSPATQTTVHTAYVIISINNKQYSVHRLVCETFKGFQPEAGFVVHHRDGDGLNNNVHNLEWLYTGDNSREGLIRHGQYGGTHHMAKLTEPDVVLICLKIANGQTNKLIAREFGVTRQLIARIRQKKVWQHLRCVQELASY